MNRDPILFRVDGTPEDGWERLNRCLTFACALQRRRRPTYFLSCLEPGSLGFAVKKSGSDWLEADGPCGTVDDATETIREIRRLRPAAVIVDSANANQEYLCDLTSTGSLVMSIDHQATTRFPSQLVVNPLLGPGRDDYEFFPGTQLLLGRRYTMVRPEIRRLRPSRSQEHPAPFSAFIALTDSEPDGKAAELAKQLASIAKVERTDIFVRPEHPSLAGLQALAASSSDRIKIVSEPAELASRLVRCHFAITSGGSFSLEMASIGVPQLIFVESEAHWPTAQRLEEEGAATCLGWHASVTASTIRQEVQNLLSDPLERQAMSRCGRQLIDGRGPDRLVTALEVMLHPSRLVGLSDAA